VGSAPQEITDIRLELVERGNALQHLFQVRSIFTLPDGRAVRTVLPTRADIVAMTEEALVAVHVVGDWFTRMIAAPCSRVRRLRPVLAAEVCDEDGGQENGERTGDGETQRSSSDCEVH
jgi:hypothetical protein